MAKNIAPRTTVNDLLIFLGSKVVQYDVRCTARGDRNMYRLGHLLAAVAKVEVALADIRTYEINEVVGANVLAAISANFILESRAGKSYGIAPVTQTLRALEKAIATGERTKITDQRFARTHVG